ncbi:MAG: hypothetical protein V1870_04600, partial [Candidatus Aenigmatarchaeota archaeon]
GILLISIIPLLLVIYYVKKMNIDIDIFEKEHRTMPYIIVILFFALASALFGYFSSKLMFAVSLAYLNVTIAMTIINLKWKISAHSAGIAGVVTDAAYVFGPIAYPLFILVPFVSFVRYKLNAHDLGQLIAGAVMAIIISYLTFSVVYPL